MDWGKVVRKSQLWKGFKFGVAGLCVCILTCGDSDLEKICTKPCLVISGIAQIQPQKMKRATFTVITYLHAQSGCAAAPEIGTGRVTQLYCVLFPDPYPVTLALGDCQPLPDHQGTHLHSGATVPIDIFVQFNINLCIVSCQYQQY